MAPWDTHDDGGPFGVLFLLPFPLPGKDTVVSYMMFELPPSMDVASPNLNIEVSGLSGHGEGTPDPDAIGIFACMRD